MEKQKHRCSKEDLIKFEEEVVDRFNDGQILSPIHLSGGNEDELIKIFKDVKPQDWIFTTYRSHYHALLKGVDKDWLMKWILDNKSIHVMNKEHKIVTSAIVGGTLSQAVGCAMAIKLKQKDTKRKIKEFIEPMKGNGWKVSGKVKVTPMNPPHVWVFCGDMTASMGVFEDCYNYAEFNKLPITFVIEDNGLSTDTPTEEAWGPHSTFWWQGASTDLVKHYRYERKYPHYGSGKFISKIWDDIKKEDVRTKGF